MPELERCPLCEAWFDPAALDEVLHHDGGGCTRSDAEMPRTGIRGVLRDEPPQG